MCGIIGYTGPRKTSKILLEGLRRLEYRGYDSAGIAVGRLNAEPRLEIIKSVGKIAELARKIPEDIDGNWGIGHTRWATHGGVTEANAHPHTDMSGKIAVVHNGIIENYKTLRTMLEKKGVVFKSETDTEVIPQLIASYYEGDLLAAVLAALQHLEGTYGIACIHADEPGRIVGARNGSPLIVGVGKDEMFLASDITAMVTYTNRVIYLNDGEFIDITQDSYTITDANSNAAHDKRSMRSPWNSGAIEKSGFMHYMEKEIFEQPESIARAMSGRIDDRKRNRQARRPPPSTRRQLADVRRVRITRRAELARRHDGHVPPRGRGAHSGPGRTRKRAAVPDSVVEKGSLWLSWPVGETADSLYAMRECCSAKGATVLGIATCRLHHHAREYRRRRLCATPARDRRGDSTRHSRASSPVFYLFTLLMARKRDMSREDGQKFAPLASGNT
jgi:glucosamine--fructose-6-phosphate aminotransferase (isomerizing)